MNGRDKLFRAIRDAGCLLYTGLSATGQRRIESGWNIELIVSSRFFEEIARDCFSFVGIADRDDGYTFCGVPMIISERLPCDYKVAIYKTAESEKGETNA